MKLGFIRHFEVDRKPPKDGMDTSDYLKWIEDYNNGDIIVRDVDLRGISWNRCYSSDMKRAYLTAEELYEGDIISTHLLREVELQPSIDTDEKKPYDFWKKSGYEAWSRGDSTQVEFIDETKRRASTFLDFLRHKEKRGSNILIVSHIIIMRVFFSELEKRGYKGEYENRPDYGKVYLFEK